MPAVAYLRGVDDRFSRLSLELLGRKNGVAYYRIRGVPSLMLLGEVLERVGLGGCCLVEDPYMVSCDEECLRKLFGFVPERIVPETAGQYKVDPEIPELETVRTAVERAVPIVMERLFVLLEGDPLRKAEYIWRFIRALRCYVDEEATNDTFYGRFLLGMRDALESAGVRCDGQGYDRRVVEFCKSFDPEVSECEWAEQRVAVIQKGWMFLSRTWGRIIGETLIYIGEQARKSERECEDFRKLVERIEKEIERVRKEGGG